MLLIGFLFYLNSEMIIPIVEPKPISTAKAIQAILTAKLLLSPLLFAIF
jgi:hypothetical protein